MSGSDNADPFRAMPSTARPPWGAITEPVNPDRFDGRHVVDTGYKRNGAGYVANAREERQIRPTQIFTHPAGDPDNRRQLTDTDYSHRSATVSPDGRWIAFTAHPEGRGDVELAEERDSLSLLPYLESRDEAPRNDSDIFVMPATGGEPIQLTNQNGSEGRMLWSPDSRKIASDRLRAFSLNAATSREKLIPPPRCGRLGTPRCTCNRSRPPDPRPCWNPPDASASLCEATTARPK